MKKALIFSRRRIHRNRLNSVKALGIFSDTVVYSDEKWLKDGLDVKWWGERFYSNFRKTLSLTEEKIDYDDMIARCRVLRLIPRNKAENLINCAWVTWSQVLDEEKPDLVYGLPIDSYVLDVLYRLCSKLNIPNFHLTYTPISGYLRVTGCGEMRGPIRAVDKIEVKSVADKLSAVDYKPNWLFGDKSNKVWKVAFRRMVIDHLKIPVSLVYRYFGGDRYSFSAHPKKYYLQFGRLSNFLAFNKFESRSVEIFPDEFIYIPLAFYPEASTDYWVPEIGVIDHHVNVIQTIKNLSEFTFVVKEHPVVYGRRPSWFYKALFKLPNVLIASSHINSGALASKAKIVLSHHSSTAFQTILNGGKVIFYGTPYYGHANFPVLASTERNELLSAIKKSKENELSEEERLSFLEEFISYCDKGELGNWAEVGDKSYITDEQYEMSPSLIGFVKENIKNL